MTESVLLTVTKTNLQCIY